MSRALFCLLVLGVAVPAAQAKDSCQPSLLAEVRLHVDESGAVFMPATVNGHEVYFSLQIGSGLPTVLESSVKALGLKTDEMRRDWEFTNRRGRFIRLAKLDDVKVGGLKLVPRGAVMIPQPDAQVPYRIDGKVVLGIMGSTLLRNVDAELNLSAGELKLFEPFPCLGRSPVYWGAEAAELPMRFDEAGTLVFTLELEGKKVEASLMAGERMSTIDTNATRKFFGFDENSPGVEMLRSGDSSELSLFHAMSLTGPGLWIEGASIRLRTGGTCKLSKWTPGASGVIGYSDCINRVPFNLGTDLVSQLRIYISRKREKVYVTRVSRNAAPGAGAVSID